MLAREGDIGGRGSDLWGFTWYTSTVQMTDRIDVVESTSRPSRTYSTRNPSCFLRRCGRRTSDSDASMNASTSFAAKQAKSSHLVTPHSLNIRLISVSTSAPGKSNNRTNEGGSSRKSHWSDRHGFCIRRRGSCGSWSLQ